MNWIVSESLADKETLACRTEFIQEIVHAKVTPWYEQTCNGIGILKRQVRFHQCRSEKGEYGFFITAHMNSEIQLILQQVLTSKKALVVINSCALNRGIMAQCLEIVKSKNSESELYFAKQTLEKDGRALNYYDNVGTFGFETTESERELFQKRELGLEKAIRTIFHKVVKK